LADGGAAGEPGGEVGEHSAVAVDDLTGGDGLDSSLVAVGSVEPSGEELLELEEGLFTGGDVAFGGVVVEPFEQVVAEGLGDVGVEAAGQSLAAGVQLRLGDLGPGRRSGAFLGVSTETMRTGWKIVGVSPSLMS
jgi:hypothetical protein